MNGLVGAPAADAGTAARPMAARPCGSVHDCSYDGPFAGPWNVPLPDMNALSMLSAVEHFTSLPRSIVTSKRVPSAVMVGVKSRYVQCLYR